MATPGEPGFRFPSGWDPRKIVKGGGSRFDAVGRFFVYTLGWAALAVFALGLAASFFLLPVSTSRDAVGRIVTIPSGSTTRDIGEILVDQGILRSAMPFVTLVRGLDAQDKLQAGFYELSPAMTPLAVITRLRQGEVAVNRLTIPEGYNLRQIAALLADRDLADRERFLALASDATSVYGPNVPVDKPIVSLEGYLFPDTYHFVVGLSEEGIIQRMVDRFLQEALPVIESRAADTQLTPHEVMTLASIVEKEAVFNRERPRIAGVFLNRLQIGQPLQADPTVQYVMDEPRPRVLYVDLAIDSPYNTYRYDGLPPGPIASPGLASIRAVLEPEDTEYMYFVARGDGTHVFTRTFSEHVAARRRLGR